MTKKKITIGIPVYNEEANIRRILDQVISQTNKYDTQIIIVSSGSTDKTNEIVRSVRSTQLIIENERKGKMSALKIIFKESKGDIVIMTDGDIVLGDNCLSHLINSLDKIDTLAATARVVSLKQKSRFMYKLSKLGCDAWHHLRKSKDGQELFLYPTGYLYALKSELLGRIKLNDDIINEDGCIGLLLYKKGIRFKYVENAIVKVLFPQTLSEFVKQKIRTRMGRRQYTDFRFFSRVEKDWRKSLYVAGKKCLIFFMGYYLLDLYCRICASYQVHNSQNPHIWETITTTKPTNNIMKYQEQKILPMAQQDRKDLLASLVHITNQLGITPQGGLFYNWNDTTISSKALTDNNTNVWIRVQCANNSKIDNNNAWNGELDAHSIDPSISKPQLLDHVDWDKGGTKWRALLSSYVSEPPCSTNPHLVNSNNIPSAIWFKKLKKQLDILSQHKTNRVAITQDKVSETIKKVFSDKFDTSISSWTTIHGDLHWGNLTQPELNILDWEMWGKGPSNYDPALLLAFSADNPTLVRCLKATFKELLNTRDGHLTQLFALAEVLSISRLDDKFASLEKPIQKMANDLMKDLSKKL